ncbi:uncharacterized protein PAC_15064 [Phialocephala subalpina]|uniref:Uncharacterized protein n=1 Tax=Phialocephala subalpina TaxID=576137 RepID=A0A1L7XJH2_9HELO|nr:uncharacterized protein PAC_15064 [Phialocephala subalpina]
MTTKYTSLKARSRNYIDLDAVGVRRWKLASEAIEEYKWDKETEGVGKYVTDWFKKFQGSVIEQVPDFGEILHFGESSSLDVYDVFDSLSLSKVLGFGFASAVYGGLHVVAYLAPFSPCTQKLLWCISPITLTFSGAALLSLYLPVETRKELRLAYIKYLRSDSCCCANHLIPV